MASGHSQMKMEGLEELRKAFRKLPDLIQRKVISKAVQEGAVIIRNEAKTRAPVLGDPAPNRKPGTLRNAIRATRGIRRASEASAFVYVKLLTKKAIAKFKQARVKAGLPVKGAVNPNDPFYWRFLEFGTSKMSARPFLRPAFDTKKEAAAMRIKEALKEGIAKVAAEAGGKRIS